MNLTLTCLLSRYTGALILGVNCTIAICGCVNTVQQSSLADNFASSITDGCRVTDAYQLVDDNGTIGVNFKSGERLLNRTETIVEIGSPNGSKKTLLLNSYSATALMKLIVYEIELRNPGMAWSEFRLPSNYNPKTAKDFWICCALAHLAKRIEPITLLTGQRRLGSKTTK